MTTDRAEPMPVLDVRPAASFERLHRAGAANIPLEEIADRIHELPPRDVPLSIYDEHPTRARWAASRLRARERTVADIVYGDAWLAKGPTQSGPSCVRLWRPHELLVEAVHFAREACGWEAPSAAMSGPRSSASQPHNRPKALDIACGTGRDAVYLALSGFEVEAWDILPDALERCGDLAERNGVIVSTACRDVERSPLIPSASFDLLCCFNFLHRPLFSAIQAAIRPGGLVVYETFVEPQRELHGKPGRPAHVLQSGELLAAFATWEVLLYREGRTGPRRIAASLIARKN